MREKAKLSLLKTEKLKQLLLVNLLNMLETNQTIIIKREAKLKKLSRYTNKQLKLFKRGKKKLKNVVGPIL